MTMTYLRFNGSELTEKDALNEFPDEKNKDKCLYVEHLFERTMKRLQRIQSDESYRKAAARLG